MTASEQSKLRKYLATEFEIDTSMPLAIVCGYDASRRQARPLQGICERDGRYVAPTLPTAYRKIRVSAFGGGQIFLRS